MFSSNVGFGSSAPVRTSGFAAKWTTTSVLFSTPGNFAPSRSSFTNVARPFFRAPARFPFFPELRLSIRTRSQDPARTSATWLPMNPAAPVIATRRSRSFILVPPAPSDHVRDPGNEGDEDDDSQDEGEAGGPPAPPPVQDLRAEDERRGRDRERPRRGARRDDREHPVPRDPHHPPQDRPDDPAAHLDGECDIQREGGGRKAPTPRLLVEEPPAPDLRLLDELPEERRPLREVEIPQEEEGGEPVDEDNRGDRDSGLRESAPILQDEKHAGGHPELRPEGGD